MPPNKRTSRAKRRATVPPPEAGCEIPECDSDGPTSLHRIVPGREGGKYVNGNVIRLCTSHHKLADRGRISRSVLASIVQERLSG